MGRTASSSSPSVFFGNERFTDLDFADDAVIFAKTVEVLVAFLDVLSKESESLGLRVSWVNFIQTVSQVSSVSCCGEEADVLDVFPYLGSQIISRSGSS